MELFEDKLRKRKAKLQKELAFMEVSLSKNPTAELLREYNSKLIDLKGVKSILENAGTYVRGEEPMQVPKNINL